MVLIIVVCGQILLRIIIMSQQHFQKLPLVLAVHLALVSGAVSAAENTDNQVETVTVIGQYTVSEKIDTATGLGLSLFETPQSVSVITEQRIIDQNFSSIADVIAQTPGLSSKQMDSTRNTFSARGFNIDKYQIDGVPMAWSLAGDSGETITDVSIYERIEVVRGSTGLLTGAGDPSASINLVRKHADSDVLKGYVNVGLGSWNNKFITTDISTPLTESGAVRARFVAKKEVGDTFMDLPEDDKTVVYGVIDADITGQTSISIGSSYQDNDPTASTWGGLSPWYSDGTRTNWDRKKSSGADWTSWNSSNKNHFVNITHDFSNGWQAKINYNHNKNTQDAQLLWLFGTTDKNTGIGLGAFPFKSDGYSKQDSFDVQLKGDYELLGNSHEFVVGALNSKQEAKTYTFAALSTAVVGDFNQWDGSFPEPTWGASSVAVAFDTEQTGYYAATRVSLTEQLKLVAGGRLSTWEREGINYGTIENYGNDDVFVPYVGLLYEINGNHNVYISQTDIFNPQNARVASGETIDPLEGTNHELGLKSTYLDGALQTSFAVFSIKQDNLAQGTGVMRPGSNPPEEIYRAAQGTESKGFELEVIGQLLENWNVSLGYSQFKAEDRDGAAINTDHPRKKLNLFTTYDFSGVFEGFVLGGGVSWEDKNYTDTLNPVTDAPERLQQDAYSLVNMMARYQVSDQISVQLNVDNLLDETYYSQIGFFSQYGYGAPRNYTLGVNYSF